MTQGYKFTGPSAQRIVDAVHEVERMNRDTRTRRRSRPPPSGSTVLLLRVTGPIVAATGLYPAVWQEYLGPAGAMDPPDQADPTVWIFGANGETLVEDRKYLGICFGVDDDGNAVFVTSCCAETEGPLPGSGSATGTPCADPCDRCSGGNAPLSWAFVGSGFTNDGVNLWGTSYQGVTVTMAKEGTGKCYWSNLSHRAQMQYRADLGKWALSLFEGHSGSETTYFGTFTDCCSPQTLTQTGGALTGTPLTVTLTPSGGCCAGGGLVVSSCCPGGTPGIKSATVTSGGLCNGSYAMTHDPSQPNPTWLYAGAFGSCGPTGGPGTGTGNLFMACSGGLWTLTGNGFAVGSFSASCGPPVNIVFTGVNLTACGGGASATITITP